MSSRPGILFITQRFAPYQGAAARRLAHLAEDFSRHADVYVIRAGREAEAPSYVEKIWHVDSYDARRYATGGKRRPLPARVKEKMPMRQLLHLRQAFPFVHLLDDGGPGYRARATAIASELIETERVQTVLSSYQPWTDHLVARALKKRFPRLRWIADFRDLPVDPIRRDVWWPALQKRWGKRVVRYADEVWCVSQGQAEQLAGWHPVVKVRRNVLDELPPEENNPRTRQFTVVYTGSLYPRLQTIRPLTKAIKKGLDTGWLDAQRFMLIYRGKDADLWRRWTEGIPADCLDTDDYVSPENASRMQRGAQVQCLLNWAGVDYYGVLTAKLYDYLATGRPLLAIVNGGEDPELADIVRDAEAGAVFRADQYDELAAWLKDQYETWQDEGQLTWRVNIDYLRQLLRADTQLAVKVPTNNA